MKRTLTSVAVAVWMVFSAVSALAQDGDDLEKQGKTLLETNCSVCHAVGSDGDSPHREAPAFRTLAQRYPIDSLAEALAEGLFTGHPDMPEFVFEVDEVGAILAYLHSIQVPKPR